jgi:hypothetical protein
MATHSTPFSRLVTGPNDDFGLKVTEYAREHDDVFKSAIVAPMDGSSLERNGALAAAL